MGREAVSVGGYAILVAVVYLVVVVVPFALVYVLGGRGR